MTARPARFGVFGQLWFQVLAGTILGAAIGWADPALGVQLKPLGDAFIALVRMMIGPVVFCTVVHGVASMADMRRAGRTALKALVYFEVVTTLALAIGLAGVNLWGPGRGMAIAPGALDPHAAAQYIKQAQHQTIVDFLLGIIPDTFVGAFTGGAVLPVLLVSVLTALALIRMGRNGQPILAAIGAAERLVFQIIGFVMWAAPIGAFGAIAFTVGKFGAASLASLGGLIAEFYLVCLVFTVVVLGGIAAAFGINLVRLMGALREEIVVVAATTSTETVLPSLIAKLKRLGCEESVVGLVVPLGYAFNLDGTCLYLATASMFLAQATGHELALADQLGLMLVMLLTSKGAAGVAGAAFIVLAATLAATGAAPLGAIALILGIHRILAEALTFVNLIGNALATLVVARWEGALDRDALTEGLARPAPAAA
ncbi:cation:dicarboxylate symporter family transporter [Phenylobacterium soli]|uniref:C4-dicarboxylate transporter DctA n=1 Tax=Phenylobacterium soli TaxID=2170551 RepID=A0A328AAN6_9CAUL|nr:cation:dicarboxylase symporter family transporter [Phenylobacterium soli]RAK51813.1 C4-dicarboxylate transporter DctA [Phenylobacterium soli]